MEVVCPRQFLDLVDGKIIQHHLYGAGGDGIVATDQTRDTAGTSVTVWYFNDSGATVASLAVVSQPPNESATWSVGYRNFDIDGNLTGTGGATHWGFDLTPQIWNGLRFNDFVGIYRTGGTGIDPMLGRYISQANGPGRGYSVANNDPTSNLIKAVRIADHTAWEIATSREVMTTGVGAIMVVGGAVEIGVGLAACLTGIGCIGGVIAIANGIDNLQAGFRTAYSREIQETGLHTAVSYGASNVTSQENADRIATAVDIGVGLLSGGFADALKTAGKTGLKKAVLHGAKFAGVEAGGIAVGAGIGYASTGTLDGALMGASFGQIGGNISASAFVKCFVAGTPVWIPDDAEAEKWRVLYAGAFTRQRDATSLTWTEAFGLGFLLAGVAGGAAYEHIKEKKRHETLSHARDAMFDDDEASWLEDLMGRDPFAIEELTHGLLDTIKRDEQMRELRWT